MKYEVWEQYYNQILADFGYSRAEDERAAGILAELTKNKELVKLSELETLISGSKVYVFGDGPWEIVSIEGLDIEDAILITADGATSKLLALDRVPDIIITDLDGKIEDQIYANEQGALVIIHAHGDNISALKKWAPRFNNRILATTQSKPLANVHDFGGFTDGDRAVFLADHFGASKIYLIGFDFENAAEVPNEGYNKTKYDKKTKLRKLTWANLLIGLLNNENISFWGDCQ